MNMDTLLPFFVAHWPLVLAFVAVLILLLFGNTSPLKNQGVAVLSPDAAVSWINHDNAHVLDVRSTEAFKAGHIVGSQSLPTQPSDPLSVSALSCHSRPLIIVAQTQTQAVQLGAPLVKQGIKQIACLQGGISTWRDAGLPLVK